MDSKNNNEFLGLGTEENLKPLSNQEIKAARNTIKNTKNNNKNKNKKPNNKNFSIKNNKLNSNSLGKLNSNAWDLVIKKLNTNTNLKANLSIGKLKKTSKKIKNITNNLENENLKDRIIHHFINDIISIKH